MNLSKLVNQINTENFDGKQKEEIFNRRKALNKMGSVAKKTALAALPLGAITAMMSTPAAAQSTEKGDTVTILNFALTAELLEESFYRQALASGVIPSDTEPIFQQIHKHEAAHVNFLTGVINSVGGTPAAYTDANFDFTAAGAFHPFDASMNDSYAQLTILSQAFEDTGVRAYKGQAPRIDRSSDAGKQYLTAALRIHSVEARHAAAVRKIRYGMDDTTLPWITGAGDNSPDPIKGVYGGDPNEGNTTQAGVNVTSLGNISSDSASQAWDEPLTMDYVVNNILVGLHIFNPDA